MSGDPIAPPPVGRDASLPVELDRSSTESDAETLYETERLWSHLDLEQTRTSPVRRRRRIFVDVSPRIRRGAKCRLGRCSTIIRDPEHRIALMPGTAGRATDYFHVSCFEKMVNLSQSYILDRLLPLTRHVMADCRLESVLVHQGLYLCDGGTERLVQEWIAQRKRWIAERNGIQEEISNFALYYLSQMAGSSTFVPQLVPGLTRREEARLQVDLAPFESDGPGDEQEWNLFTSYLTPDNHRATLHDRHNLSNMLRCWAHDVDLVIRPDFKITPAQRQEKDRLGEKAIRAITRLARVPLPE